MFGIQKNVQPRTRLKPPSQQQVLCNLFNEIFNIVTPLLVFLGVPRMWLVKVRTSGITYELKDAPTWRSGVESARTINCDSFFEAKKTAAWFVVSRQTN